MTTEMLKPSRILNLLIFKISEGLNNVVAHQINTVVILLIGSHSLGEDI